MDLLRYAAFSADAAGGNPAGVVLDTAGLDEVSMLAMAAEVGYSETAFLTPTGPASASVRYFSPLGEIDFCGHATIAAAVAKADRDGPGDLFLETAIGPIHVGTSEKPEGMTATLVSAPPRISAIADSTAERLLSTLGLSADDLDPALPLRVAYAGNQHPIVAVTAPALDGLDYDQEALARLMDEQGWAATVAVVHRTSESEFEARNPFPPGGIREDPVTGSAAAALGGYLRLLGIVLPPTRITVQQGRHVGRPGRITVDIPVSGGIAVSGVAVRIA